MLNKTITLIIAAAASLGIGLGATNPREALGKPDLKAIKEAVTDENSPRYYQRLLNQFMSNDTVMSDADYQYFYYGTLFQEDYDPYRPAPRPDMLEKLAPIYAKSKRTRSERQMMLDYAMAVLQDNPVNLRQLVNRVYVYEQNGKYDLAKIWQHKLNHMLLVIAASGDGTTAETAWTVVYPGHEYDFLNLLGLTASAQRFEPPCYDYIEVKHVKDTDPAGCYFNISDMLEQYFMKHPSELEAQE